LFDEVFVSCCFLGHIESVVLGGVVSLHFLLRRSLLRDLHEGFTGENCFCPVYGVSNGGA
jgi:hypothetical protein